MRRERRKANLPMTIRVRLFIEVFAGTGRLAAAVSRVGFVTLCWDINMGEQYDLSTPLARRVLSQFLQSAAAVHLGVSLQHLLQSQAG